MGDTELAFHRRSGQRGQTIILVAVAMVSLLAMAALAIDVVTLYLARSEMQRAADAAALGAAKAFVDSGITSDPTNATRQDLAQTMATNVITSILPQNRVSGAPPVQVGLPVFDFNRPGNPQVTVTLQRTDLPTFFARIWGRRLATVSASATAEAYNPAGVGPTYPTIAPKCVKPLLVLNQDPKAPPTPAAPLIDPTTGAVATNVVGEQVTIKPCPAGTCPAVAGRVLQFRPALVNPGTSNLCPGACTPPASDYETSIDCCDSANPPATQYECGNPTPVTPVATAMPATQITTDTNNGLQCVTNLPAEDRLDPATLPDLPEFSAGTAPVRIIAGSGPQLGNFVTTSRSIITFPIVQNPDVNPVRVIGFVQVFVDPVTVNVPTSTPAHILNVIGCGGAGPPVLGGGYAPIPVRLIH